MADLKEDPNQHSTQEAPNNKAVSDLFAALFPDIQDDMVYEVARITSYLYQTSVNPDILPRVIRSVFNIMSGTGEGQVIIHVRKGLMTLEAKEHEGEIKTTRLPE